MKKVIVIFCVLCVVFGFQLYKLEMRNQDVVDNDATNKIVVDAAGDTTTHRRWFEEEKIYLSVCATGTDDSYLIELSNDGVINTRYGFRETDELEINEGDIDFEIEKQDSAHLENVDLENISKLLDDIKNDEKGEKERILDSWEYILWIGTDKYYRYLGKEKDDKIDELIQVLMKVSPIYVHTYAFA